MIGHIVVRFQAQIRKKSHAGWRKGQIVKKRLYGGLFIPLNERGEIFEDLLMYIVGIAVIGVLGYFFLGYGVNALVARIPVSVEKQIFSNYQTPSSELSSAAKTGNKDEPLTRLQSILEKLVVHNEVPPLDYRLFIIEQDAPNAVALPGGGIGVTRGLMNSLNEEIELAFVIGHELGHFRYRDHLRGLGRAMGIRLIVTYFLGESEIGRFLGGNALVLMDKKYSREQEEAADRFGVLLVYKTYGDVDGTTRLFEILQKTETTPKWAYMFSTHPATSDRIAALKKYAHELKTEEQSHDRQY